MIILKEKLKEVEGFAEKTKKETESIIPGVVDELNVLRAKGEFVETICLGQSSKFACWEGNKKIFDIKNRLKGIREDNYQDRILKATYKRYLKALGKPTITVFIHREDETFVKCVVDCPFYDTITCVLKNFTYHKEREEL
ncbi:MAG: hypothetical protein U9Q18_03000 [Caldisericota bacterium]|nr:hypothetical protein [Caldisericota bacterium]